MSNKPKVSIVIPVYNAEQYLPQTLDSILNQSLREIEVICVDDGSTDDSLSILQDYANRDHRVQLFRQQNLHAGVARNVGLEAAQGEYVHFLDADDYVLDYAYEAIYNKAVKYDLDCLKFASVPYDAQLGMAVENSAYTLSHLRPGDFHRLLTSEENSPLYSITEASLSGIYRRSFLSRRQISFPDSGSALDRVFYFRVITNAQRMMVCRDTLVVHRLPRRNSSIQLCRQQLDDSCLAISQIEHNLQTDGVEEEIRLTVIKAAIGSLFALCDTWRAVYSENPEQEAQLAEQIERCSTAYQGSYPELYGDLFVDYRKTCNTPANPAQQPLPVSFWHDACPEPKVSVVIPTYNVEEYLNEALHSLSIQTLEDLEFLCVNDGSTDGSLTIIKEYAARDKRFRILDGPNGGYGKAMNRGIDAARGEYLGILEPDDYVAEDMFRHLYATASKHELDFVKADFHRFMINEDGSMAKKRNNLSGDSSYYGRLVNPSRELETFRFIMNTWSGIYKLDFLNRWHIRHNETPGASYQDNGFWFQTFCRATRAWFVKKPFYMNRRDNPNSSMFSKKKLYCATDEYRYIWNWMSKEPALVERFAPIFYVKKLNNFMLTYHRVSEEYRLEYLHHICDEFGPVVKDGLLDRELAGETNWMILNEILADPDAYYEKIRVSVIIPVYNAEQHLRQCLDSILLRTEMRFEVICVDDGSTDSSLEILREYEAKYPRFTVLTQKNAGAGAARNYGLRYAKGEYLSFLDADDFFEPGMLRIAYDKACVEDADILVFRSNQYIASSNRFLDAPHTINRSLLPAFQPFSGQDVPRDVFKLFVGWAWDKLLRADFVRENGLLFQEQRTSNDMLFVFSAVVKAERIATFNTVFAHHRRDAGSLSVTREQSWACFYHALVALRQQLKDWGLYERFERDFINYSQHFALWNLTTLRGPSYYTLYDKLRSEWIEELGISGHSELYFYNQGEYRKLQSILTLTPEEFLFQELDETRISRDNALRKQKALNAKLNNINKRRAALDAQLRQRNDENYALNVRRAALDAELRQRNDENYALNARRAALDAELRRRNDENYALNARLQRATQAREKCDAQIRELKAERKRLKKELAKAKKANKQLKKSAAYRIGRYITWPVRKAKALVKQLTGRGKQK